VWSEVRKEQPARSASDAVKEKAGEGVMGKAEAEEGGERLGGGGGGCGSGGGGGDRRTLEEGREERGCGRETDGEGEGKGGDGDGLGEKREEAEDSGRRVSVRRVNLYDGISSDSVRRSTCAGSASGCAAVFFPSALCSFRMRLHPNTSSTSLFAFSSSRSLRNIPKKSNPVFMPHCSCS
jgi:hypothetical protein